ncbi:MAG: restriction endonuclease [Limnohabitans sp.]
MGAEHLRELLAERERAEAASCSCMTLGSFSPAALALARAEGIQLLGAADVAQLMHEGAQA